MLKQQQTRKQPTLLVGILPPFIIPLVSYSAFLSVNYFFGLIGKSDLIVVSPIFWIVVAATFTGSLL
jgi:uncharacterized membrane protein